MSSKLVSILTPCYNGEKYLDKYFSDILSQDYSSCELLFIDDGSTDATPQIVEKYRPLIEKKGYELKYIRQENMGQGIAVANSLKFVTGEYLIWPDCDDRLHKSSISVRVRFLEEHPEYGMVRSEGIVVDEKEPDKVLRYISGKSEHRFAENIFSDYLFGKSAWLQPGSFMVRMSAFDKANPERYIYPIRYGQNWQMVLPVLYHFKCGYIDTPLFTYVLHKGSSSDINGKDYEYLISREEIYYKIVSETIKHMQIPDEDIYLKQLQIYYTRKYLTLAYNQRNKAEAKRIYSMLKKMGGVRLRDFIKVKSMNFNISHILYRKIVGN